MKYKVGDKVKIKSLEWFKVNEYSGSGTYGDVLAFLKMTDECCGKELTIDFIFADDRGTGYIMKETKIQWRFTDSMIEGPVEHKDKMVSLEAACDKLFDMLSVQDINDQKMVGTWAYEDVIDFINDFCKRLEE